MNYKLQFKHYEGTEHVHRLVEDAVARLRRLLTPADAVSLRVLIEKNDVRTLYRVSLTLVVPGRTLAVEEERHDENEAVRESFAEIERQLVRYRQKATHAHEYERPAQREAVRRQKIGAAAAADRRAKLFSSLIEQHLDALYNFVRREIAYHIAMRDLVPGGVANDDIVAAVAVRAAREFARLSSKRDARGWLLHLATQQIDAEVARVKRERRIVHLDAAVPATPRTEAVSMLGDETLDFYQPHEDWKVEDVLAPARAPTPEEILASKQLQHYIARTLSTLPRAWRRVFVLRALEDLPLAEVARISGRSKPEAEADINHAREYLRQRLIEAGLAPHEESVQSIFGTAPRYEVPAGIQEAIKGQQAVEAGAPAGPVGDVA